MIEFKKKPCVKYDRIVISSKAAKFFFKGKEVASVSTSQIFFEKGDTLTLDRLKGKIEMEVSSV